MDIELPEEVQALLGEHEEKQASRLATLGQVISQKRGAAVNYRKSSGIEEVWLKAEEAYLGIDDSNRSGFASARWAKPTTTTGPVTASYAKPGDGEVKSDAFVRLTSRYVDAGTAKLCEILLPIGEKAFSFGPTPVAELVSASKDNRQIFKNGVPLTREPRPGEPAQLPGAASQPPGVPAASPPAAAPLAPGIPLTVKDLIEEANDLATVLAKKAERRVYDWMTESRFPGETRKVIFDAARIGTGVLKGPFPKKRVSRAVEKALGKTAVKIKVDFVPGYTWADVWNIYPDPACGENIHNGDHIFELDYFSPKQLRDLKGQPGYLSSAIDQVIEEGPKKSSGNESRKPGEQLEENRFPIWYFYGTVTKEDLLAAGAIGVDEKSADAQYAIVTMVNETVIRATLNPLDSGEFPYHAVPWQRRAGYWAGVGVGEQLELPQRAINAATRGMFNNAGKSAGGITVMDRDAVTPADGSWVMTPDKIFLRSSESIVDDVRKAFVFFQIPNVTPQMMTIIEYCLRLAEESTSIPLVTQGQSGKTTPETFGATQLQNNNANQLLRSIGYAFDDYITEPVVRQSYEMLLLDPDVPDDEKGDWQIDAHGSIALVERAIQEQTVQNMGQFVKDSAFGVNPKKWFAEYARGNHLNPKSFQYTEEEQAKIAAQPPPPAPAVQVAQIRSADMKAKLQSDQQLAELSATLEREGMQAEGSLKTSLAATKRQVDEMRIKRDTDRDVEYVRAETQRSANEHTARMAELEIKRELAILEYATQEKVSLGKVKADLAKETMRLTVQKELAGVAGAVDLQKENIKQVATAGVEPPGKAPDGAAFQA